MDSSQIPVGQSAVAIFSSREDPPVLLRSVKAALVAMQPLEGGVLDVVVNGNWPLAEACAELFASSSIQPCSAVEVRLWHVPLGDKAHAWNTYMHGLWPGSHVTFFVDGYAEVRPDAFGRLREELEPAGDALAASGVPSVGRSARPLQHQMIRHGGIHGNLYALGQSAVAHIRENAIRLPLGLYRTDSLLGAILHFGFDPVQHRWEPGRIAVVPAASWSFRPLRWWHPRDLWVHWRRLLRQEWGRLENLAIRQYLSEKKGRPEKLPYTADSLVDDWTKANAQQLADLIRRRPLVAYALRKLHGRRDWSQAEQPAVLLWNSSGQTKST
jgi:hypothetical protein